MICSGRAPSRWEPIAESSVLSSADLELMDRGEWTGTDVSADRTGFASFAVFERADGSRAWTLPVATTPGQGVVLNDLNIVTGYAVAWNRVSEVVRG